MRVILSVFLSDGKKENKIIDSDNIPPVPVELRAEIIGKGGSILSRKEPGQENFVNTGDS